jgi:hypothetical protein
VLLALIKLLFISLLVGEPGGAVSKAATFLFTRRIATLESARLISSKHAHLLNGNELML